MCDNAISKQIRHILSHNFPLVQFIPVMLSCVGYTSTFCFMVLLFFTFFLGFLHDQTLNVSLHIIITQGRQILFLFFSEELSNQCSHPFSMPGIFIYIIYYYSCTIFVIWHDNVRSSEFNTTSFAVKT